MRASSTALILRGAPLEFAPPTDPTSFAGSRSDRPKPTPWMGARVNLGGHGAPQYPLSAGPLEDHELGTLVGSNRSLAHGGTNLCRHACLSMARWPAPRERTPRSTDFQFRHHAPPSARHRRQLGFLLGHRLCPRTVLSPVRAQRSRQTKTFPAVRECLARRDDHSGPDGPFRTVRRRLPSRSTRRQRPSQPRHPVPSD